MGEAKRKASQAPRTVYHHTSSLRSNLIWMSGVIELEGNSKGAYHPQLGEIQTDVRARRACEDFPPLAWFTSSIRIPRVLLDVDIKLTTKAGQPLAVDLFSGVDKRMFSNGITLNRMALGFPIEGTEIIRWREHYGYGTREGQELNDSAREAGDDPDLWFVADKPVDVLKSTEVWISRSKFKPKLERHVAYLADVHRMVKLCRETPGVYIPPAWLTPQQAKALTQKIGANLLS